MSLNQLGVEILAINRANGWDVPTPEDWMHPDMGKYIGAYNTALSNYRYKIPTSLMLIVTEVAEATEEFRKDHRIGQFGEELADVLIRTIELGVGLGIDLDLEVEAKMEKNRHRGERHGGRLI